MAFSLFGQPTQKNRGILLTNYLFIENLFSKNKCTHKYIIKILIL